MIHGVAWQTYHTNDKRVWQTIFIPAARMRYVRFVDADHTRQPWKITAWTPKLETQSVNMDGLRYAWENRGMEPVRVVGDPVLFQIMDEEYLAIKTAPDQLHRNIGLRFHRALVAQGLALFGAGAKLWDPKVQGYSESIKANAWAKTVDVAAADLIIEIESMIRNREWTKLDNLTPQEATARGAGYARNGDNLPVTELPPPPAAPPGLPPVPDGLRGSGGPDARRPPAPAPVEPVASPAGPGVEVVEVKPGDTVVRPNGELYFARTMKLEKDISDVQFYRQVYAQGFSIFNRGVPGTGKSAGFEAAFPGMITMVGTDATTADDFVGSYVQTGPETFEWVDGPLLRAMEGGVPLYVDEIGVIDTRVLPVLYPLMDGRREILVTANPLRGIVHAQPGFGVIGSTNPHAPGVRLSEALMSRFTIQLEIGSDFKLAKKMGVNARMVEAAEHMQIQVDNGDAQWCPQMRELLKFRDIEAALGLVAAIRSLISQAPEMERPVVTAHLRERFGDLAAGVVRRIEELRLD